jgi:hypothetical protein
MKLHFRFLTIIGPLLMAASHLTAQRPQNPPPAGPQVAIPVDQQESPADQLQGEGGTQTKPLTPLEERDRQIRQFDQRAPRLRQPLPGDDPNEPVPSGKTPADARNPADSRNQDEVKPLPGSVAAANQERGPHSDPRGPRISDDAENSANGYSDDYNGPAVLTRSYTLATPQAVGNVRFRYTLGVNGVYDSSFSTVDPAAHGGRFGSQYTWGASGRRVWKKNTFTFSYLGAWNEYPSDYLRGYNHSFQARYSRILTRRLTFNLVTSGSILSQGYSLENPVTNPTNSLADVNIAVSPSVQLLDTITRQVIINPSLTWQKSARLSFTFSGSWLGLDREGPGLLGQTGFQAQADVNYRITRRITTGAYYNATFYDYAHDIAFTSANGVGLIFSAAFDRSTQLRLRGGVNRYENQAYTTVQIDPALAAILGTSVGIIDSYQRNTITEISAELARDLHRNRTATLSYTRGLAPGNGQILASLQQAAGAGFNMRLLRQYVFSTGLGWTNLNSPIQGKYETEYVFLGLTRPVTRRADAVLRVDYRKFTITSGNYTTPNQLRVALGVNWTSADGPLRLW